VADLGAIYEAVVDGDAPAVKRLTQAALAEGVEPSRVLHEALIPAMAEVGRRMKVQEYFVPEVLISARAMQWGVAVLKPKLVECEGESLCRVAIGTVHGDIHDIGKNLVGMILQGAGFDVIDLGIDVTPDKFVAAVREKNVRVLAISALLTTTMLNLKKTIEALKVAGVRDRVKVLVGGAPLSQRFAEEIGADAYAADAADAADVVKELLGLSLRRGDAA